MRRFLISCLLMCASFVPSTGTAQIFSAPAQPPAVNAASAQWQINSDPIFFAGSFYYPAGPTVFFDGNVMVRSGVYEGIPVYANNTYEPWSVIFVPIGGNLMRPYERLRAGELAGTTGSRTPSFPVQGAESINAPLDQPDVIAGISSSPRAVVTGASAAAAAVPAPPPPPAHVVIQTIPAPTGGEGVWVEFQGTRWYHAGRPVSYDRERFESIGSYRGFGVFKEMSGGDETIYVASVREGGPLTPYSIKR